MTAILEIKQVGKKSWETKEGLPQYLFQNMSSVVFPRDRIALLGKSGQGKSTFLRCLSILDTFDNGSVVLDGAPYKQVPLQKWRTSIVYVAQQSTMLPGTIEDNLKTVSRIHNRPFEEELAKDWMKELGLDELGWNKDASLLSGGEKQRLAIARTLGTNPKIICFDEPTSALDPKLVKQVFSIIKKLAKQGKAILIVSHDIKFANEISNRIIEFKK